MRDGTPENFGQYSCSSITTGSIPQKKEKEKKNYLSAGYDWDTFVPERTGLPAPPGCSLYQTIPYNTTQYHAASQTMERTRTMRGRPREGRGRGVVGGGRRTAQIILDPCMPRPAKPRRVNSISSEFFLFVFFFGFYLRRQGETKKRSSHTIILL